MSTKGDDNGKICAKYNKKVIVYEKSKSSGVYKIILRITNFCMRDGILDYLQKHPKYFHPRP